MEKQTERTDYWTWGRGRKGRICMQRVTWKPTLPYVRQTAKGNMPCDSGSSNRGSVAT